ncbi:restriction endonuclease subunit R [Brachyspira hampsonii]|uniref:Restriction endonuclease subunit R n=1 Tax=Brachyspira hampsonii TaxID=1287055 RepID=A0A1E5NB95_9SPIR|nr:DEAD/DEAH box helicase family protein [Brachyspira hampsonii]OEJ13449.1 restriction endonuclease subunit R [Brachyspira hampsonii]
MTEEDIKQKLITPAIKKSGWKDNQINYEYAFTDGRFILKKKDVIRDKPKRADYLLSYKSNIPLAIIEAKSDKYSIGHGIQQAIDYAEILDLPFAYSSNGYGFLEHDMLTGREREISIYDFPKPEELWNRYKEDANIDSEKERIITTPYYYRQGANNPRYYQRIAINRTIKAAAEGKKRILLVMATGTGKTYTAFQIIHRFREANLAKKILFLADRNILIDQTMRQDFKPFKKVMTKIENKKMDSSYEVYLSLYQQLITNEDKEIFKEFSKDFFNLIIVDECHRGSAKDDSLWRRILEYFSSAVQIGLTATPKETKDVSSISYFGEPIYTYSLKQGIDDGFLAPFKVIRVGLNTDLEGWRPYEGQKDADGNEIENREYNVKDFDRNIVIKERDIEIAKIIIEYIEKNDRFAKTIVFCEDIEHAERMRKALINEHNEYCQKYNKNNLIAEDSRYIMRITGDEIEGKKQLDSFIEVDSLYPTIVTTSKLLTTGVDCKTCKLIVLINNIDSMTEFKQIIGRGTRIKEDYGKKYFTIMDFKNASRLFSDPDFDGEALSVHDEYLKKEENVDENINNDDGVILIDDDNEKEEKQKKVKIVVNGVEVEVLSERVQYFNSEGKLITESLTDYTKKNILGEYATLDSFINDWNSDKRKSVILEELSKRGVFLEALREYEHIDENIDDFDLICHLAYDKKPLTKSERINNVKKRGYLNRYEGAAREVIDALLEKYMDNSINDITDKSILLNSPFSKFGSASKIFNLFGGKENYNNAVKSLQKEIYKA